MQRGKGKSLSLPWLRVLDRKTLVVVAVPFDLPKISRIMAILRCRWHECAPQTGGSGLRERRAWRWMYLVTQQAAVPASFMNERIYAAPELS